MHDTYREPPEKHTIDIVLVGGGHTHVQVVKAFGMNPLPGVRLSIIAKELNAPYSGMLPGLIAGHYGFDQCHIDLVRLAHYANARIIHGSADGIDRKAKRVLIGDQEAVPYDLLSIDVGITPNLDGITGAQEHTIAVKPISAFWPKWERLELVALSANGPRRIVIIGAGAAGFELSLAADYRIRGQLKARGMDAEGFGITLVAGDMLLPTHSRQARNLAYKTLRKRNVALIEGDRAVSVSEDKVTLSSGRSISSDAVLVTTGASAPAWFADTDLPLDEHDYLALRPTLQLQDDDAIFAAGDCASVLEHPREKSGVFAVRQGPPLIENLRRVALGQSAKPFTPQKYFLTLLSLADETAIAAKGPFCGKGKWAWWLKDWIDQKFMKRFQDLPDSIDETRSSIDSH